VIARFGHPSAGGRSAGAVLAGDRARQRYRPPREPV